MACECVSLDRLNVGSSPSLSNQKDSPGGQTVTVFSRKYASINITLMFCWFKMCKKHDMKQKKRKKRDMQEAKFVTSSA